MCCFHHLYLGQLGLLLHCRFRRPLALPVQLLCHLDYLYLDLALLLRRLDYHCRLLLPAQLLCRLDYLYQGQVLLLRRLDYHCHLVLPVQLLCHLDYLYQYLALLLHRLDYHCRLLLPAQLLCRLDYLYLGLLYRHFHHLGFQDLFQYHYFRQYYHCCLNYMYYHCRQFPGLTDYCRCYLNFHFGLHCYLQKFLIMTALYRHKLIKKNH